MAEFLDDGYQTTISTTGVVLSLLLREKEVQPPALSGRGAIDVTTMRNLTVVTKAAKSLIDVGDVTLQVSYDPAAYTTLIGFLLVNRFWTIRFPDLSGLSFWAFMDSFAPASMKEGEFPLAEMKLIPSNVNGADVEVTPVHSNATFPLV